MGTLPTRNISAWKLFNFPLKLIWMLYDYNRQDLFLSLCTGVNLSWLSLRPTSPITLILGSGSCRTSASHCSTDTSTPTGSEQRQLSKNNKARLCIHWVFQAKNASLPFLQLTDSGALPTPTFLAALSSSLMLFLTPDLICSIRSTSTASLACLSDQPPNSSRCLSPGFIQWGHHTEPSLCDLV